MKRRAEIKKWKREKEKMRSDMQALAQIAPSNFAFSLFCFLISIFYV
jgi:hypothetical protein